MYLCSDSPLDSSIQDTEIECGLSPQAVTSLGIIGGPFRVKIVKRLTLQLQICQSMYTKE